MNIEVTTETEKTRLRRRFPVKAGGWLFPIVLAFLLLMEVLPFWFLGFFFLAWFLDLLPEDYFLTEDYIQRRGTKLLYKELQDVRSLLYWYIITDEHGESIWVPYPFLEPEDKDTLDQWLGIDKESMAEQGGAGNEDHHGDF